MRSFLTLGARLKRPLAAAFLVAVAIAQTVSAQETPGRSEASATNAPKRTPLVVIRQAEIAGRVFLLSEEAENAIPARKLTVEVWSPDERTLFVKTQTDEDGRYILPNLDIGTYRLRIGALPLELMVEDFTQVSANSAIPKTILFYIPTSMAK